MKVHVHFFESPSKPFQLVDIFSDLFSLNSPDRVAAIRDIHRTTSSSTHSSFRMYPRNRGYCEYISDEGELRKLDKAVLSSGINYGTVPAVPLAQQPDDLKRPLCCVNGTCPIPRFIPDEILNATSYSSTVGNTTATWKKELQVPANKNKAMLNTNIVRSQFYVQGICCSSETSQILAILQPIKGVELVRVNAQLKSVVVDHDPSLVQAMDIAKALDRERFKSRITEDGGLMGDLHLTQSISNGIMGDKEQESRKRSQFFVENICCAAEIRPIQSILESMNGIHEVSINVTTKMVYVRHDVKVVNAMEIESRLRKEGFRAQVLLDVASAEGTSPMSDATLESVDDGIEIHTSKLNPLIVISGLFWIISMFSYVGGNW